MVGGDGIEPSTSCL